MFNRLAGPLAAALILVGVVLVVTFNLNLNDSSPRRPPPPQAAPGDATPAPGSVTPAGFREYPIGDPVEQNRIRIGAVWLPPIQMDGTVGGMGSDMIHLEADIHATEGNPNGFAKDEFVPYMAISYKILSAKGGEPIHKGELIPMVAGDGLHYGASIVMPEAGEYRLVLNIQPPALGRHSDPVTGVAPWWKPFEVSFDWDYPGPPKAEAATAKR